MAKLALLAFTLTTIVAFSDASHVSGTTIDDNDHHETLMDSTAWSTTKAGSREQYCRQQNPIKQLNHCQKHLTHGIISNNNQQQHLQDCCTQLKKASKKCQCDAIQRVYDEARKQGGVVEMRQMLRKAQKLPIDCKLEVPECPLVSPRV